MAQPSPKGMWYGRCKKKKKIDLVDIVNLVLAPFGFERCSQMLLSLRGWIFGLPLPTSFIIIHSWCWLSYYIFLGVWRIQSLDRIKIVPSTNLVWERFNSPSPLKTSYWHMIKCFRDCLMNFLWINAYSRKLGTHLPHECQWTLVYCHSSLGALTRYSFHLS